MSGRTKRPVAIEMHILVNYLRQLRTPEYACDISAATGIPNSVVSSRLTIMKDRGYVESRKVPYLKGSVRKGCYRWQITDRSYAVYESEYK